MHATLAPRFAEEGYAASLLRFGVRGWNGDDHVVAAHGRRDRITSARRTRALLRVLDRAHG